MMYSKLAFRNIRRSLRDYIIYFVTLTLTAALMYSFLALGFSPDILAMTENMSMLTSGILMLSVLVALLSSFVVGYAIRFMLGQRKKEFAAYELMGMEVKTVRNLFLVENSIIGGAAFLLGSLLGTAMSGLLNQVVQNIFEIPHRYQVLFSLRALGMTLFFFILMYGFGMLRAAKVIRRRKVIDLLYDNQKNEEAGFQPLHRSVLTCLLSLAAMVAGVILLEKGLHIQTNEAMLYWGGACLLILAGVYELHRKIPMLLYQLAKRNPHRKYREETLFFLGQIGRRIQSSGRTMAVVAILLTVSLATMFVGMTMGAGYKANMEAYYPYDAGVAIDAPLTKDSMDSVRSFVEERCEVEDSVTYYLYAVPNETIEALSLSDYNHLREILGLSPVSMNNNEFLVHCDTWNYMDGLLSGFDLCVDATHPYARLATAEIRAACERTGVSLLRLLRPASQIEGAVRVSSCQTAAEFLADEGGNVLLATGAKELSAFGALDKNRLYVRVLPTHEGLSACEAQGIPHNHILALQGPFSQKLNEAILEQYRIAWLVTKDGGRAGGLGEKLSAAQAVGARVVLVERPPDEGEGLEEILEKIKERLV